MPGLFCFGQDKNSPRCDRRVRRWEQIVLLLL